MSAALSAAQWVLSFD